MKKITFVEVLQWIGVSAVLVFLVLFLAGCKGGIAQHLYGPDSTPTKSPSTLVEVACCPPIQSSTAQLCNKLLHGEGVHGTPPDVEYYIDDGVNFYLPETSVCDHAQIK